jgi:hypothetical protein
MTVEELMQKLRLCNPKSTVHVGMPSGWEEADRVVVADGKCANPDVFLFSKSSPAWVTTKPL